MRYKLIPCVYIVIQYWTWQAIVLSCVWSRDCDTQIWSDWSDKYVSCSTLPKQPLSIDGSSIISPSPPPRSPHRPSCRSIMHPSLALSLPSLVHLIPPTPPSLLPPLLHKSTPVTLPHPLSWVSLYSPLSPNTFPRVARKNILGKRSPLGGPRSKGGGERSQRGSFQNLKNMRT